MKKEPGATPFYFSLDKTLPPDNSPWTIAPHKFFQFYFGGFMLFYALWFKILTPL
jgi:hypothetical protein